MSSKNFLIRAFLVPEHPGVVVDVCHGVGKLQLVRPDCCHACNRNTFKFNTIQVLLWQQLLAQTGLAHLLLSNPTSGPPSSE